MNESERLVATFKKLLKREGYTYRDIGAAIGLSEQSVKRLFSSGTFTLERLVQLSALLKQSLAEIAVQANTADVQIRTLTETQEKELTSDPDLLLVAVCVLNNWTLADIVGAYRFTKAECLKKLFKLERIGLITVQPGDRVRLNVARDFDWLRNGPIQHFFQKRERNDFFACDFDKQGEQLAFLHGMLTPAACERLGMLLKKLREDFADLHRESLAASLSERRGVGLLLAFREWEPQSFALRRRQKAK